MKALLSAAASVSVRFFRLVAAGLGGCWPALGLVAADGYCLGRSLCVGVKLQANR